MVVDCVGSLIIRSVIMNNRVRSWKSLNIVQSVIFFCWSRNSKADIWSLSEMTIDNYCNIHLIDPL